MIVYVVEAEEIIGYILGGKNRHIEKFPAYDVELYAIYILEEYQGKGIGKLLVSEFFDALKEEGMQTMIAQVLKENPAKMFYQRLGASYVGETSLEISDKELAEEVYGWDLN